MMGGVPQIHSPLCPTHTHTLAYDVLYLLYVHTQSLTLCYTQMYGNGPRGTLIKFCPCIITGCIVAVYDIFCVSLCESVLTCTVFPSLLKGFVDNDAFQSDNV